MIEDAKYRAKLRFRARSHADLALSIGGIYDDVDARLGRRDVVRVLELGCGYGTVLLELAHRYGSRIELHGINLRPGDGNPDILRRNGIERGLIASAGVPDAALPAITYADVAHGIPFADESFDIVYSQVAWLYFGNKIGVLREVSRVLRSDGLAKIDADELRPGLPPEYRRLVEIWADGRVLPFGDYVRCFGAELLAAPEGEYLRLPKSPLLGADVTLVCQLDLSELHAQWDGVKCIYRRAG